VTICARAAHLSAVHLGRLFRAHVATSPMQFLRKPRIEQSRFLLERSQLRIGEVAREVGFEDPLHFSRVFSKSMGLSPRQYRRKARAPEE